MSLRIFIGSVLSLLATAAAAEGPRYVATYHSIGLYWSPPEGAEDNAAAVEFRKAGGGWRPGLAPWFDARNGEYRGSLVELEPGTRYEIRLSLRSGRRAALEARTWTEQPRIQRTVQVPPGTPQLVIDAADSGDAEKGYVLFTAAPGRNVIDQQGAGAEDKLNSCVLIRQGTHHVIVRGLELRNCRRAGVLIERQFKPVLETRTHDIVIEDNEISGWGGFDNHKPGQALADNDAAVQCNYYRETEDAKRPERIVIQRNVMRDPRHPANPWIGAAGQRKHPMGPQGVLFSGCGTNHVIRYNEIYSTNGNYFMDGLGGDGNFTAAGFPWADSDIYGNRISEVYDDGIEAEGGNRNVRIWGNYLDRVFVAIGNAATAVGPLYVWRNVSNRMAGMHHPGGDPDSEQRGPFVKAGSRHPTANGGRAYYFHNTVLQPPAGRYGGGAGWGIQNSGGRVYNVVSRNNLWQIHKPRQVHGQRKFASLSLDADHGLVDVDFDLYNGALWNAGRDAERHGWKDTPRFAAAGSHALKRGSPGWQRAERIPNFNDRYERPDVGAQQSGAPALRFGLRAASGGAE